MIIKEILNETLERHYSDAGFKIQKVGTEEIYDDAIDLIELHYEYIETDIPIDSDLEPDQMTAQYVEAAKILLGEQEV